MDVRAPETQAVIARLTARLTKAAEFEDQRAQEARDDNDTWEALHHEGRAAGIRYALAEVRLYGEDDFTPQSPSPDRCDSGRDRS